MNASLTMNLTLWWARLTVSTSPTSHARDSRSPSGGAVDSQMNNGSQLNTLAQQICNFHTLQESHQFWVTLLLDTSPPRKVFTTLVSLVFFDSFIDFLLKELMSQVQAKSRSIHVLEDCF